MAKVSVKTPALYGDHHVLEVRKLITALPGVREIYASSCFHRVEVDYDPDQVSAEMITAKLGDAGYLDDLPSASEDGPIFPGRRATGSAVVSFSQTVDVQERPAWPCPGLGLLAVKEKENG